jgi:hypothetical protein
MFKTYIRSSPWDDCVEIVFVEQTERSRRACKPIQLVFEEKQEGARIEPSLKLYGEDANNFLKSIAQALDESGVKTDMDAKIEGTLEATRFHLEDLRKLLKLK